MTGTHEKFMEQARQVTKTILCMDPCYPEQFEMRDIIAAALVAAHQDGIREGKRQAADEARELASAHRNRCNRSFDAGDQGSAIIERNYADELDEFAATITDEAR